MLVALSPPSDAELLIVHVKEPPHYLATPMVPPRYRCEWRRAEQELQAEMDNAATTAVAQTEQILSSTGASAQSLVREGHPAHEIIRAAEEVGADLIVLGYKGLSGISRFLLGSVAQRVSRYSHTSVLLVRMRHVPRALSEEQTA